MPISERGRLVFGNIDERGRIITGALTEQGYAVFGITTTGTVYTKSLSDSVIASDTVSKRLFVTVIDFIPTSDGSGKADNKTLADVVSSTDTISTTRGKAVNLADNLVISDAIGKAIRKLELDNVIASESERESVIKRLADSLAVSDVINTSGGKAVILSDSLSLTDAFSKSVVKKALDTVGLTDNLSKQSSVSVRLYDVVLTSDTMTKHLPNAPVVIGRIKLIAERNLRVRLLASRELRVTLRGDISLENKPQNFTMLSGESKYLDLGAVDNGAAVDLAGSTIKWVLKSSVMSASNLVSKEIGSGITITNAAGGEFTVEMEPLDTKGIHGTFYHEAELTDALGNVSKIYGFATIKRSGI